MPETLTICARIEAKTDKIDLVKSEVIKLVKPTIKEEGCLQYILHQDIERPEIFIFIEKWENGVLCEKHMRNRHAQEFIKATDGLLANIDISKMRTLG